MKRMMKLVEESSGVGELMVDGQALRQVRYRISRYQGMVEGSGLPIPGLHRIEGSIDFNASRDSLDLIGTALTLRLEDGRVLGITLAGSDGRILSEGHGPMKCSCC
jgi:hypothetical protein